MPAQPNHPAVAHDTQTVQNLSALHPERRELRRKGKGVLRTNEAFDLACLSNLELFDGFDRQSTACICFLLPWGKDFETPYTLVTASAALEGWLFARARHWLQQLPERGDCLASFSHRALGQPRQYPWALLYELQRRGPCSMVVGLDSNGQEYAGGAAYTPTLCSALLEYTIRWFMAGINAPHQAPPAAATGNCAHVYLPRQGGGMWCPKCKQQFDSDFMIPDPEA